MSQLRTIVFTAKDGGGRHVYHTNTESSETGWAWEHPDSEEERKACSACMSGTLESARKRAAEMGGGL